MLADMVHRCHSWEGLLSPSLESCMVHSCTKKVNPQGTEMLIFFNSGLYSHCMSWIKQQYPLLEIVFFSAIYMGTVLSTLGLFYFSSFSLPQTRKTRVLQNRKFGGGLTFGKKLLNGLANRTEGPRLNAFKYWC